MDAAGCLEYSSIVFVPEMLYIEQTLQFSFTAKTYFLSQYIQNEEVLPFELDFLQTINTLRIYNVFVASVELEENPVSKILPIYC